MLNICLINSTLAPTHLSKFHFTALQRKAIGRVVISDRCSVWLISTFSFSSLLLCLSWLCDYRTSSWLFWPGLNLYKVENSDCYLVFDFTMNAIENRRQLSISPSLRYSMFSPKRERQSILNIPMMIPFFCGIVFLPEVGWKQRSWLAFFSRFRAWEWLVLFYVRLFGWMNDKKAEFRSRMCVFTVVSWHYGWSEDWGGVAELISTSIFFVASNSCNSCW